MPFFDSFVARGASPSGLGDECSSADVVEDVLKRPLGVDVLDPTITRSALNSFAASVRIGAGDEPSASTETSSSQYCWSTPASVKTCSTASLHALASFLKDFLYFPPSFAKEVAGHGRNRMDTTRILTGMARVSQAA